MEHDHLLGFLKGSEDFYYASQQKKRQRTTLWERYKNVEEQNANSLLVLCKET
jgi:hypothetical protein